MARILVIEDDSDLRFGVARALRKDDHEVVEAATLAAARKALDAQSFDVVLTDYNLGDDDGLLLVEKLRGEGFAGAIIVMTGFGSVELAVRAMKGGADDFLEKPVKLDELRTLIGRLLEDQAARRRLKLYERLDRRMVEMDRPIGDSEPWRRTVELCERLARMPVIRRPGEAVQGTALPTILLLGETGTGKGVLARHIHECGTPEGVCRPFVHVNCSALPPQLVEGELFGHERGAFTDARESKEGLFEMADGGTLFLDEIGDLPLEMQTKLLTVLESGTFRRVGGTRERSISARVIAATNHDLEKDVSEGRFRRDLYYRLNAFTVTIPPLRQRQGDALLIAQRMLERYRAEYGLAPARLTPQAEERIASHQWVGNVRELINAVQRAAMLVEGDVIDACDLTLGSSPSADAAQAASTPGELRFDFENGIHTAEDVERELMIQALKRTRGNVSRAARMINMQRSSFRYRIERYKLDHLIQELAGR
ncbi:MAG: sigma-54 dependent transcriptional regulator [Phycisphaerales bacterium]